MKTKCWASQEADCFQKQRSGCSFACVFGLGCSRSGIWVEAQFTKKSIVHSISILKHRLALTRNQFLTQTPLKCHPTTDDKANLLLARRWHEVTRNNEKMRRKIRKWKGKKKRRRSEDPNGVRINRRPRKSKEIVRLNQARRTSSLNHVRVPHYLGKDTT